MSRLAPADHPRRAITRRDPHGRLLFCLLQLSGAGARIDAASSRPWASATFNGSCHAIDLRFEGCDAHARAVATAEGLPDADFTIPGFIVADVTVDGQDLARDGEGLPWAILRLSVLVIEDW